MNATKLIGLTTALGVAMTAAAAQFAGVFPGSTDFEGVTLPDSYTTAANGAAIVAGNPDVANRPTNFVYAATRASVLSTEEADGTVLRNLKANGDAAALADGTTIYADLLFKASAAVPTDGAPPQVETGDQILIYLKDEGSATNLCVFARGNVIDGEIDSFAENEGEGLPFVLDAPVAIGSWHRLVVEAINDVTTNSTDTTTDPGFKIYLDGTLCTTAAGHDAFLSLTGDGSTDGSVTSIGFRGAGFVDDLVVSTLDPSVDVFDWATHLGAAVDGAYEIDNEDELIAFQKGVANGLSTSNTTFKLTADIALTAAWPGIGVQNGKDLVSSSDASKVAEFDAGAFCGVFDGQNHTISGFQMQGGGLDYCGFFNSTYGATIRNLKIQYAGALFATDTAANSSAESGATFVGVAKNSTLVNLTSLQKDAATGVSCDKGFGGIVGYLTSGTTVDSCTNNVNLTSLKPNKAGGIAMITQGGSAVTIRNCQNNGTIAGSNETGGLVGYIGLNTTIADCESTVAYKLMHHQGSTVTLSGTIKGNATVASYTGAATAGLKFATVSGDVATFVADNALALNGSYKVMVSGAAYQFTEVGSITFDKALAVPTVTSDVANYHVVEATSGTVTTYSLAIDQYTVSWDADGGTLSGDGYTSGLVDYGTAIIPPTATKADDAQYTYTFVEWMPALDKTVTSNVTYTAIYNAESLAPALPEWASDANEESFNTWKKAYSVSDTSTDYSDQYLMNVAPTAAVVLKIESITVASEGTQIVVGATANGSTEIDMENINGVLNVTVSQSIAGLASAAKKSIPAGNLGWDNNKAVITIPATDGTFVKASVDYTAGSTGLTPVPTSGE